MTSSPYIPIEFAPGLWRSRQPRGSDWEVLKNIGIKTVIDLQAAEVQEESRLCALYDIKLYTLPLSSVFPPSGENLRSALIQLERATGDVLVHCLQGVDRTGFVVGKRRINAQGWTKQQAAEEMIQRGNHWWLRWWTWFL